MNPDGCPTKYEERFAKMAFVVCADGGLTDKQLAKLFDVNPDTIYEWKKVHPEFSESVKAGKLSYDNEAVENSLLKRALGYSYTETTSERGMVPIKEKDPEDPEASVVTGKMKMHITKKVKKHVPGDVKAIQLWLTNRNRAKQPDGFPRWMNLTYRAIELTGKDGGPALIKLDEIPIRLLGPGEKSPDAEDEGS